MTTDAGAGTGTSAGVEVVDIGDLAAVPEEERLDVDPPGDDGLGDTGPEDVSGVPMGEAGPHLESASRFAAWERATRCTGGPTEGARALLAACLDAFGPRGATNLGIYNCRDVRGASGVVSCHGEGRACDVGFPLVGGRANPEGTHLADALRRGAGELGLQAIIWNRTIWSARSPGGRPYEGAAPHVDHVHVELSRAAAGRLTRATAQRALQQQAQVQAQAKGMACPPPPRPLLRNGSRGSAVVFVQRVVGASPDGVFGPRTADAVRRWQAAQGISADGVVGPQTWGRLERVVVV